MGKDFINFIEDSIKDPQQAKDFLSEVYKPGQTADGLYAFFQKLPGYDSVTHEHCIKILKAAEVQGPLPTQFEPKY
jgi:hypothetical protein